MVMFIQQRVGFNLAIFKNFALMLSVSLKGNTGLKEDN